MSIAASWRALLNKMFRSRICLEPCLELSKHSILIGFFTFLFFTRFVSFSFLYHATLRLRQCVKMTSALCYFRNEFHATRNRSLQCTMYMRDLSLPFANIQLHCESVNIACSCNISLVIVSIIVARNIDLLPSIYKYLRYIYK